MNNEDALMVLKSIEHSIDSMKAEARELQRNVNRMRSYLGDIEKW